MAGGVPAGPPVGIRAVSCDALCRVAHQLSAPSLRAALWPRHETSQRLLGKEGEITVNASSILTDIKKRNSLRKMMELKTGFYARFFRATLLDLMVNF